jgi:hypothetical protein
VGVVVNSFGPMVSLRTVMSPGTQRREDQGHILGLDADPCIVEC